MDAESRRERDRSGRPLRGDDLRGRDGPQGLDATTEQYGEAFRTSKYQLWHANAAARRLLDRGIKAPLSGHPKYNVHANDIDFQIESDFIGLMTPGLPQAATPLR